MATTSNMFMYSLTIQPPTAITQALLGQFAGTKEQQIITASGPRLSLLQLDPRQGKTNTLLTQDIFGIIRCISAFRLAGSHKGESSHFALSHRTYSANIIVILDPVLRFGGIKCRSASRSGLTDHVWEYRDT